MERHKKRYGVRMDKMERDRKREARKVHKISEFAQKSFGLRAKLFNQRRFKEKASLRKTLAMHQEGSNKHAAEDAVSDGYYYILLCNITIFEIITILKVRFPLIFLTVRVFLEQKYYRIR